MLDGFRIEPRESNNDEVVILADEGEVHVIAKIPCRFIDRISPDPLSNLGERIDFISRNLGPVSLIVQRKFNAGEFRNYQGLDGRHRWIVLERADLAQLRPS
jgi:hypothetical protein